MNTSKIDVLGVKFNDLTPDEAVSAAMEIIDGGRGGYVVTPNPEIVMAAGEDGELLEAVNGAELVLPDGIGVIYGAKILGTPLKARVPGIDFASGVTEKLAVRGGSVFLFGSKPGVAEKAAETLKNQYKGIRIAGCENGYFTDDTEIVRHINEASPDFLFVCLGFPKQEKWMAKYRGHINAGLMAGLGGSLDVFAGNVKRAPLGWQKLGLEWLYRLLSEPKRIGRMMKLPLFLFRAIGAKGK